MSVMQSTFSMKNLVCCYPVPKVIGKFNSVRPVFFCIALSKLSCVCKLRCRPPDLFDNSFAGWCAEDGFDGGGVDTSTGDKSVEVEDPLVNPSVNGWSNSGNLVSTRRSSSPTTRVGFQSPGASVWCSVACVPGTTKGMWLSNVHGMFSH